MRRDGVLRRATRTDRGLSPVVGKTLELGVVVLFVALLSASFYGGIVPEYRTAAAAEVGDRALAGAAERVESAVPERTASVDRRVAVSLPTTLRGDPYRVRAVSDANATALVLEHPDDGVGGRVDLSLPARGAKVTGTWESTRESWVVVRGEGGRVAVSLESEDGRRDGGDGDGGGEP